MTIQQPGTPPPSTATEANRGSKSTGGRIRELSAAEVCPVIDPRTFGFATTDELPPLDRIVGQPRAERAIEVGLGLQRPGYHIYVSGVSGTGRMEMIRRTLNERARTESVPPDWVYVNNFDVPDQPTAISLKAGQGAHLKRDMQSLIGRLLDELPKAFQREDFGREKERLRQQYLKQGEQIFEELAQKAKERGVELQHLPNGEILFVPLKDGKPITPEESEKLTPEEVEKIERYQHELVAAAESVMLRQEEVERQLNADVRQVERTFAARLIEPLLAEIGARFQSPQIDKWVERLKIHFIQNLDRFRRRADRLQPFEPAFGEPILTDIQERFVEYQVNVLVDNGELKQAPVVFEPSPNYKNLFGTIERMVDRYGRVVTSFARIKAGSLLRANGGYLVFSLEDALTEPFVWKELKRMLNSGQAEFEVYDPYSIFTVSGLKPAPVPLNIKLVVVGNPLLYHLLTLYDEEFREIFKIKADFDTRMDGAVEPGRLYGQFVQKLRQDEGGLPFDASAIAELARASARLADQQGKLTAEFARMADIVHEAAFWARKAQAETISECHVRQALQEQVYRSDLVAAQIRELIANGTLLISLGDPAVGQGNGLAVADLGDYSFGWPTRVTASVGIGAAGLINIERESRLSGRTFDKGVLILEGYLRNMYAREHPLALSASLTLEQSYGRIDGDSASIMELLCLLSAVAEVPLRQDVAVTGSVNQWGQVQAIGGANEKIEGFFDVCRQQGLTGRQGVCIPAANVQNLVLRHDLVEAITRGQFHVWAIDHVDQGFELLTGIPAGSPQEDQSFHGRVDQRLRAMSEALKGHISPALRETVTADRHPAAPPDPRPPLPGRDSA